MTTTKIVRITEPSGTSGTFPLDSTVLSHFVLHACGGGFTEDQTARAMQASHDLADGKEVVLGNWRFEPVQEGDE